MRKYSELVITAFATYTSTTDLSNITGLSRSTIVKYKKDNYLQELADERRMQIIKESVYKMQSQLTKCVDTLIEIRDNEELNPQTRIYATNCLMNHCKDWTITADIVDRVEKLEDVAKKN